MLIPFILVGGERSADGGCRQGARGRRGGHLSRPPRGVTVLHRPALQHAQDHRGWSCQSE